MSFDTQFTTSRLLYSLIPFCPRFFFLFHSAMLNWLVTLGGNIDQFLTKELL